MGKTYQYSEVNFSVDGLEDTNHLYRQGVKWEKVEDNMVAFCDAGWIIKWTFLVFRHNEHQVNIARGWALKVWCTGVYRQEKWTIHKHSFPTGEDWTSAEKQKGEKKQYLEQPLDPKYQNKELPKFKELEKKYGTFKNYLEQCTIKCKPEQKSEIYISIGGLLFPC